MIVFALSIHFKWYNPFETICRIGDMPNEVYYVVEGKIAVTNLSNSIMNSDILEDKVFHYET